MVFFVIKLWQKGGFVNILSQVSMVLEVIRWAQSALNYLWVWSKLRKTSDFVLNFASNVLLFIPTIFLKIESVIWSTESYKVPYGILGVTGLHNESAYEGSLWKTNDVKLFISEHGMFLDFATCLIDLGVHRGENGSNIAVSYFDTFNMTSSSLRDNIDEVLNVLLITLLTNAVEYNRWRYDLTWLARLPFFRNELQYLFSRFSNGHTAKLSPEVLRLMHCIVVHLS